MEDMTECYENLANAIIIRAFEDYTPACRLIKKREHSVLRAQEKYDNLQKAAKAAEDAVKRAKASLDRQKGLLLSAEAERDTIEGFFTSQWFQLLSKVDGEQLLKEAKKQATAALEVKK